MSVKSASEQLHQITLVSWFDKTYPSYAGRLFAIPNGGLRAKTVAIKLSMEGVRRGVPDLFLPIPNEVAHGFFIELKKDSGRPTKEQEEWVNFLSSVGYRAEIIYGWEEASKAISDYMEGIEEWLRTTRMIRNG